MDKSTITYGLIDKDVPLGDTICHDDYLTKEADTTYNKDIHQNCTT